MTSISRSERVTVDLESDVEAIVRELMLERGLTFTQAVNAAIRIGAPCHFSTPVHDLGTPTQPLDKAVGMASELGDEARMRELGPKA